MKFLVRRKDVFDYDRERTCLTCSTTFRGKYCGKCGEKILEANERSLRYFFQELVNAFTFLDGKFPRSFMLLMRNPGELSRKIVMGIRQPFMKPVSLFFVANFLYFFLPSFEVFNTAFKSQLDFKPFGSLFRKLAEEKMIEQTITLESLEMLYNQNSGDWAKLLLVILVVLFSVLVATINFSRSRFYSDHLTLSFEFLSFTILFVALIFRALTGVAYYTGMWLGVNMRWLFEDERFFLLPTVSALLLYFLIRTQRTFYQNSWFVSVLKSVLLFAGFAGVVILYRFTLVAIKNI
jgi:hypothetical protein